MLRITSIASPNGSCQFKVEGRLAGAFVDELSRVTADALGEDRVVVLNLAYVTSVDQNGAQLLRSLRAAGVELVDCSPFVLTLMNGGRP